MFGNPKLTTHDSKLDRFCGELLSAVRVSEEEIAATVDALDAYDGVRLRIAEIGANSKPPRSMYDGLHSFIATLLSAPRFVVLSSAAAIFVALAVALVALLPAPPAPKPAQPESTSEASATPPPPQIKQPGIKQEDGQGSGMTATAGAPNRSREISRRRVKFESRLSEVATDFLPLTFVDDSNGQQSGHIVRMKVPRSALIAFGVPMNMDRAGELITADVMIGEDGLARAIRFVQ